MRRLLILACCVGAVAAGCSVPGPTPLLPPMGWNSWNSGVPLTEQTVMQTADAMVSSGLRDAGYRYVNLDAGWAAPVRASDGRLQADPARFPRGISALARYVHDRGMNLGIYHSPFNQGCGQDPRIGGAGHERTDAQTFADWGVDYLKYDWCRADAPHDLQVHYFTAMRNALRRTGRRIFYSINPNSSDDASAGARYDWSAIADMNRNSVDLVPTWGDNTLWPRGLAGVAQGAGISIPLARRSSPNHINDPDMLVIGVGWDDFARTHPTMSLGPAQPNLTDAEQRAHISLWAMLAAPLLAGNDVRAMTPQTLAVLTNRDVIAIDQDPLVAQARPLAGDPRVWVKPLADGSVAVALTNPGASAADVGTTTAALGLPKRDCYAVRDLWSHTETHSGGPIGPVRVAVHGASMFRIGGCR